MNLRDFLQRHERLVALTGAGISTASGIPDYRDAEGAWKRAPPMTFQAFTGSEAARRRYWARSLSGWPAIDRARPNTAHLALARLEAAGRLQTVITQNVDGLHRRAGQRSVIDLHGRIDRVVCLGCGMRSERARLQDRLLAANPQWRTAAAPVAPDGDADLNDADFNAFRVPACEACGGLLKPDVVFYGESVPRERAQAATAAVDAADALLVVGSTLTVFSSYRLARQAAAGNRPIAAINLGRGRADDLLTLKVDARAEAALAFLL